MKKVFLIIMLFLLPLQYTWAMVASYDTHSLQDAQAHFGHHEHKSLDNHNDNTDLINTNDNGNNTQTAHSHAHYGFCHLSCGEVLAYELPIFGLTKSQLLSHYLFNYLSPTTNTLERPNWTAAI